MLPGQILSEIENELSEEISNTSTVHGGDINQAAVINAGNKQYFLKWNTETPEDMFETEAKGLEILQSAGTELIIPEVIACSSNYLVLSLIKEGGGRSGSSEEFGRQLAQLHRNSSKTFGLDHNNYIGRLPQSNRQHGNWPDFFALERIEPQIKMGVESGKLNRMVLRKAEQLYKRLGSIFPNEKPALLHGDLWSGNYMFTHSGNTCIYDPAVYYGHREMDLSMTRLFGGFSADFYRGYEETYPIEDGFEERVTLCNLYPVLVHANLFGGSYCRQAESIINKYV